MTDRLIIRNLYKVFGNRPEEAMRLVREGLDKNAIFERTGQTLGVNDATFNVQEGEIFVVNVSGRGDKDTDIYRENIKGLDAE